MVVATAENVGSSYSYERMLDARGKAWEALRDIASRIGPGMA